MAPVYQRAFVGVLVVAPSRSETLYQLNAHRPFTPASNQKILTSLTALSSLGADYRFRTTAHASGEIRDERLEGDLVLRGGGDPVLMQRHLEDLARQVKARGIRRVQGSLVADESRFDSERIGLGWEADDEDEYYAAQTSALTVNRNVLQLTVTPSSVGAPPEVTMRPLQTFLEVENRATTVARGEATRIDVDRVRGRNVALIEGTIAAGHSGETEEVTMESPALFTLLLFRKALADEGVTIEGGSTVRSTAGAAGTELASVSSAPLSDIVRDLNKPSDNLIAEMLLKAVSVERWGRGTTRGGLTEMKDLLKKAGADEERVRPVDGSGLSRHNLVAPRDIVQMLTHARSQPYYAAFRDSLPVAGVDGTLRARMNASRAERAVSAKTGTLSHVSALSGYIRTAGGEELIFSVMTNNWPGSTSRTGPVKGMEDQICLALAAFSR